MCASRPASAAAAWRAAPFSHVRLGRRACCSQALGEELSEDEVREMVSEAISNFEERIYYDGFVKTMISKQ